jgi:hypothetical protein
VNIENMEEEHLMSSSEDENLSFDNYESSDDDSSVEITSTIDECENELICLLTYFQLESEEGNYDNRTFKCPDPLPSLLCSDSSNFKELIDSRQVVLLSKMSVNNIDQSCRIYPRIDRPVGEMFYFSDRFCISDADIQEKPTKRKRHTMDNKRKT